MIKQDEKYLYYDNYNAKFYKFNNDLYKIFKNYVSERLENQLMYNNYIREYLDKRIILPKELLYDEKKWLVGYKMDFVKGSSITSLINNNNLDNYDKLLIANDYFYLLKDIHEFLKVGDIRNSNLIIDKNKNACMIDFDYACQKESANNPFCRYHISYNEVFLNNQNEDIVKLYISMLSLFYNHDIEKLFYQYVDIKYLEYFIPYSGYLKDYYYYMIDQINHNKQIKEYLNIPINANIDQEINSGLRRINTL